MSNFTLTIDDFDPVVHYANYEVWQTPNPQEDPTAWNKTESKWNQGEMTLLELEADLSDVPQHDGQGPRLRVLAVLCR